MQSVVLPSSQKLILMRCFHQADKCERPAIDSAAAESAESDALLELTLSY